MSDDILDRIATCPDNIDECWNMLEEAATEIKRLREEAAFQKAEAFMQFQKRCSAEGELSKWHQIVVEERARYLLEKHDGYKCDLAGIEHCPVTCYDCEEDCSLDLCLSKDFWRSIAAKELNLQMEQEASYVERLEADVLALHRHRAMMDGCDWTTTQDEAQAALAKIRENVG